MFLQNWEGDLTEFLAHLLKSQIACIVKSASTRFSGIGLAYLIFVIYFTQAGFSKTKFYTQKKTTKDTKNTKKCL